MSDYKYRVRYKNHKGVCWLNDLYPGEGVARVCYRERAKFCDLVRLEEIGENGEWRILESQDKVKVCREEARERSKEVQELLDLREAYGRIGVHPSSETQCRIMGIHYGVAAEAMARECREKEEPMFKIEFDGCKSGCPHFVEDSPKSGGSYCRENGCHLICFNASHPDWCPLLKKCGHCDFWVDLGARGKEIHDIGVCLDSLTCGGTCVPVYGTGHSCDSFKRRPVEENSARCDVLDCLGRSLEFKKGWEAKDTTDASGVARVDETTNDARCGVDVSWVALGGPLTLK